MGYQYTLDMTRIYDKLQTAQALLTEETVRLCDPYVPRKTGRLAASVQASAEGVIIYDTPYARYPYYRHRNWLTAMKQAHGAQLIAQVKEQMR